jgi:hypothetical protein
LALKVKKKSTVAEIELFYDKNVGFWLNSEHGGSLLTNAVNVFARFVKFSINYS